MSTLFAPRDRKPVRELIVTGPRSPSIGSLDDLVGRRLYVRKTTSYYESLTALNDRFTRAGKPLMLITLLPDLFEDEDTLEMLNAGMLGIAVVDDWKAKLWAQVLPQIKFREDLVVRSEGYVGWAIRKNGPQLQAVMTDVYNEFVQKQSVIDYRLAQFMKRIRQVTNASGAVERKRFEETVWQAVWLRPLMLAAQRYQESQLNQSARSHAGAVGVMQLMPGTAIRASGSAGKSSAIGQHPRPTGRFGRACRLARNSGLALPP